MRGKGALAAALLAAVAGCIGALGDSSTGMGLNDDADEHAGTWDEDAALVSVYGAEGDLNGSAPGAHAYNGSQGAIGDGQAPAWNYTYENDERALSLLVAANETVIDRYTHEHDNRTPITGWEIDSTEAIEALEDANETWANADPHSAFYALDQNSTTDDPVWSMALFEHEEAPLIGVVNATTGDVIDVYRFEFDFNFTMGPMFGPDPDAPDPEEGSFQGTLTISEPEAEHAFEVQEDGHAEMTLVLQLEDPAASQVTATIEGPSGTTDTLNADATSPQDETTLETPAPGPYSVHLEMEQGVTQDYRVEWCAHSPGWFSGFNPAPYGSHSAC